MRCRMLCFVLALVVAPFISAGFRVGGIRQVWRSGASANLRKDRRSSVLKYRIN
ncbi:MAG: hypothetical protein ACKESB_02695 [Candidatus Hodgkinia cicadicola]